MAIEITSITEPCLEVGEGPHWDASTQTLYFVDIYKSTIHKYMPSSNQHNYTKVVSPDLGERPISLIIPVKGKTDEFIITYGNDIALIKWDGINDVSEFKILMTSGETSSKFKMNDGKVSPNGILFAGSMVMVNCTDIFPRNQASVYAFVRRTAKKLFGGVEISNGLAWSSDGKIFYYIDTRNLKVEAFDYDEETVELTNRRTIFDFPENKLTGMPDGMTIDTDGNLWVACFEGSKVIKIDPKTGQLLTSVELPCPRITSVAFGGETLEDLYVTSAYKNVFKREEKPNPKAGCLFKIAGTGAKGIAGMPFSA